MPRQELPQVYSNSKAFSQEISQLVRFIEKDRSRVHLKNLSGSAFSFWIENIYSSYNLPMLLLFDDKEEAAYYLNDLEHLISKKEVIFFPGSYRRPYQIDEVDNANVLMRAEVLNRLNSRQKPPLVVSYPDALFEKVVAKSTIKKNTLTIKVNEDIGIEFLNELLFEYQFKRVDFVTEPGDFSVRGGILDVFSFSYEQPYRIEFYGDLIESIRIFDIETQYSTKKVKKLSIIPNLENKHLIEKRQSFLTYLPSKTTVFSKNLQTLFEKTDRLYDKAVLTFNSLSNSPSIKYKPNELFCDANDLKNMLSDLSVVEFGHSNHLNLLKFNKNELSTEETENTFDQVEGQTSPQPSFNKHFSLLIENLKENRKQGYQNFIACTSEKQSQRLRDVFQEIDPEESSYKGESPLPFKTLSLPLYQGFIDHKNKIACYTDHQIFGRHHKFRLKSGYTKAQSIKLKALTDLEKGDFVSHYDHGIGRFGGLQKIEINGKSQEAIKLIYGERDILYLSIHSLHKITKYNGKDGKTPKLHKLGSNAWKNLKKKTKTKVKEIAFSLIDLYAKRKLEKGFSCSPDSYLQHELESSFLYEDTKDQESATNEVKKDMESKFPMDRLICGDVGFGKTEVGIRAAFKAVDNGKQAAILVPTTILAFQHYKTFTTRLEDFPVTIDYLNRFRSAKDRKRILNDLSIGKIDIVIGTHQLVNPNIKFKDLGLLIVDEEQKFGVAVKEKIKTLKESLDVLTLSATPIPRTLQFSLMAARDLSIIKTPPPNRQPIESQVLRFSKEVIRDAISYEIQRGGQVFFIHNRIENLREIAGMLQELVPDAKIGIGHGQMDGKKLEDLMLSFINNEIDVLVSTTIIENGLDVPNANTIFINEAHHFGLSDLHQMRGRVGRSNKKAFCYFITPDHSTMTQEARKRISAIEQHSEIGSGFNIALKDLEIRGAGDLLGGEQSGFINEMGFGTYQKILDEAITELKETTFKNLYGEKVDEHDKAFVAEVNIDTDLELLFPDHYINNTEERLRLYTELSKLETEEQLKLFKNNLIDRFGKLPEQAVGLIESVKLKWIGKLNGIDKWLLKNNRLTGYFIKNDKHTFYQSKKFDQILSRLQHRTDSCQIKQKETRKGTRLLITFDQINSVDKAVEHLNEIFRGQTPEVSAE